MIPSSRIGSMRLDPRLAAQKHAAPQPCAQQQQPHFSSLAIAAHNLQQALSLGGLQNRAPAPMAHIVPHSAASAAQQGAGLHTLNLPLPPPQPAYASVATLPQSIQPMQVPSHPQPFPTQQAVLQQNPPYFAGPSPGAAPLSPRPAAPVAPSNEELMAALLSLSSKLGGGTAAGKAGGQATSATARSAGAGAASTSMQHYGKVTGSLSFHPSILKVWGWAHRSIMQMDTCIFLRLISMLLFCLPCMQACIVSHAVICSSAFCRQPPHQLGRAIVVWLALVIMFNVTSGDARLAAERSHHCFKI